MAVFSAMLSGRKGTTNKIASQGKKDAINKNWSLD